MDEDQGIQAQKENRQQSNIVMDEVPGGLVQEKEREWKKNDC
jgi:hypothetical protein